VTQEENIFFKRNHRLGQWAAGLLGLKDEAIYHNEMGDAEEYAAYFCVRYTSVCDENGVPDVIPAKPLSDEEVLRKLVDDLDIVGITEEDILAKMKSLLKEVKLDGVNSMNESNNASQISDYGAVPWYRRSSWMSVMLLLGFLICSPLMLAACIICLTGNVYYSKFNEDGSLATWSVANKVAAVIILLLWCFLFFFVFADIFSNSARW
jgi:hypothetical protein